MTDQRIAKKHLVGDLLEDGKVTRQVRLIADEVLSGEITEVFTDGDTTPSVAVPNTLYRTANTGATTISDFDDGFYGQSITVQFDDANTTVDFTASSLVGNGGADWSPAVGDSMRCVLGDDDNWYCSVTSSGGVSVSGTPVNNQIAIWTDASTLEGDADLTYDGNTLQLANSTTGFTIRDGGWLRMANGADTDYFTLDMDTGQMDVIPDTADYVWAFHDATKLRLYDSTDTDYVDMYHDGTDFNFAFTTTTDWNITGITAISAGAVDADFDAITSTTVQGASVVRSISASTNTAADDGGKTIRMTGGSSQTFTLDGDPPSGAVVLLDNASGNSWTIAASTSLIWAKDATTGNRTLADDGIAVAVSRGSGTWVINGSALLT